MKYFIENGSKVYAITNSKSRTTEADAMLRALLNPAQKKKYREMKKEGKKDSEIFNIMYPSPEPGRKRTIQIGVDELTKPQLITQINKELKSDLDSLERMNIDDLREMLLALHNRGR